METMKHTSSTIKTRSDRPHWAWASINGPQGVILMQREFEVKNPAPEYRCGNQAYAIAHAWVVANRK
jgi:hypothetical protein